MQYPFTNRFKWQNHTRFSYTIHDMDGFMNERKTYTSPTEFTASKYQCFSVRDVPFASTDVAGFPLSNKVGVQIKPLSWAGEKPGEGALTASVLLTPAFTFPSGSFSCDVEIFVTRGVLQIGTNVLRRHGYSYIPAGQVIGPMAVLKTDDPHGPHGDLRDENTEVQWMQSGTCMFTPGKVTGVFNPNYIPITDSYVKPWGGTQTAEFTASRKKWLRKAPNGGGTWLLGVLPHFDSNHGFIQNYNEEALCVEGSCEYGEHNFTAGYYGYVPYGTVSPRHISPDGCLFLVRVDQDLSQTGRVASFHRHASLLPPTVDWSVTDPAGLPGPCPWVPKAFVSHIGSWEGTYTHLGKDGKIQDFHYCKLDIGIHGKYYSQRNTYWWKDESGTITKEEVYLFHGAFDNTGFCRIDSDKIAGWGKVIDSNDASDSSIIFYGAYKAAPYPDTFDLIRQFDAEGNKRFRTWQVKLKTDLLKIVHVEESRTSRENTMWIPRGGDSKVEA